MPTKHEWKLDLDLKGVIFGHKKSPFPAMERIGRLIAAFEDLPGGRFGGSKANAQKLAVMYYVLRQCEFVIKNNTRKDKLGGTLSPLQLDAVRGLRDFVYAQVRDTIGSDDANFDRDSTLYFGRTVSEHGHEEDAFLHGKGALQYYTIDQDRAHLKLAFRHGKAYKWGFHQGGKVELSPYDTDEANDALEYGGSLYVMDGRGRLYVSGQEFGIEALKHSSFMGGLPTLAAGTLRVENGQVVWVSGRSGHYRPKVAQMVNLLERLRGYSVDLTKVVVYRENERRTFEGSPTAHFEPCDAVTLLSMKRWPTLEQPDSMFVAR
ncbi:MAG: hypothetical protein FJ027_07825 [Candidatus Rokubacteria bacterium]|nr:hypothetical protein [Candidatus Rokubacteria bacterium]